MNLRRVKYQNIDVSYVPHLDGGGRSFGQDFVPVVKTLFGKVGRICEFACGPGFIGFSLLAHGLCETLCLIDVNPEAIEICRRTIRENGLENRVSTYVSDALDNIPKHEKWDLVVSNPPHLNGSVEERGEDLRIIDPNWLVHEKFYKQASHFLSRNGSILFVENVKGSDPRQWRKLIEQSGLHFAKNFPDLFSLRLEIAGKLSLFVNLSGRNLATFPDDFALHRLILKSVLCIVFRLYRVLFRGRVEKHIPSRLLGFRSHPYYFVLSDKKEESLFS